MNFLVVEDDVPFLELIRHALEPRKVRVALTLKEAIAMIDESAPEVMVLDLSLPDSPASQTIARIRELKTRAKNATVIVITGLPETDKIKASLAEQGADNFLEKNNAGFFGALSEALLRLPQQRRCAAEPTVTQIERTVDKIVRPEASPEKP